MSDDQDTPAIPTARVIRRRWPGLVWAVPVAALLVVAYLGLSALANRGTDVTVIFASANGVSPGDTKVLDNGVEVGRVSAVRIAPDNRHVELTLHLDHRVKPALTDQARFWMIGANPNIADLQSVKAAIAGVAIGMEPGSAGRPARHFTGLDQAPVIPFGARGKNFVLMSRMLGTLVRGASIRYRGLEIGKVTDTTMDGTDRFRIAIWIHAPFDRLIREGSEFWTASPLKVKLGGGGLSTELAPASLLQGAIQFDLPDEDRDNPPLAAGTMLTLFDDQGTAQQGDPGPEMPYALILHGDAGDMAKGTPVTLMGYQVGEVGSSRLLFDPQGGPFTLATIQLYAHKFGITPPANAHPQDWRSAMDAAVSRLLHLGYRAKLTQTPPLVGAHGIAIVRDPRSGAGTLDFGHWPYPAVPVSDQNGSTTDDIMTKVDQIVTKINRMPLDQIGHNVQALTANVRDITTQVKPKVGPLMDKLNATASGLDAAAAAARTTFTGEGANQGEGLPETIRQLNEMSRSIRSLTDYLGRHPEALIRGKSKDGHRNRETAK
ncbi:PqiB family protein [Novosphingobium terrae]|uniref:PqiB family protein n=1 Tax=Novosphingobium terrae TaxID=2726189 RepID=UPI00197ED693|nr:MlaD family protein [Novosphingobium terrae]